MNDRINSPSEPNEEQLARSGIVGHVPSTPLDPSPDLIRGLGAAETAAMPLDPTGERTYQLSIEGQAHSIPLDPTPEQLHRLGLADAPNAHPAPTR
jgi:hypothetical protein